jgi:hypothetical protein
MRNRSEEAATPGSPATLARFWEPQQFTLGPTAAEPALHDRWQRDVHACSESTFSHSELFINKKSRHICAKAVDDETSLWKVAEKVEKIRAADQAGVRCVVSTLTL